MKYLHDQVQLGNAECADDALPSLQAAQLKLDEIDERLNQDLLGLDQAARNSLLLESSYLLLDLDRGKEAWERAHRVFSEAIPNERWLQAGEACDIIFQADQNDALRALAHGIWLGVTYPIAPELSVALLQHLVEESPDRSDGAAVAAATASFIVDMRAQGPEKDELRFFTTQMLGEVARRHSKVDDQEIFDFWVERLELNDPSKFLPRLAKVLDILAAGEWWFDRDELRNRLPE